MHGKTVGVIGLGRVGQRVSRLCLAFGMRVLANDPYVREEQVNDKRIQLVGMRELLGAADYVSRHVPATDETIDFFTADMLNQMKTRRLPSLIRRTGESLRKRCWRTR